MADGPGDGAIAVVGMAGRFPGAAGVEPFWENLAAGVDSVRFFRREELAAAGVDPAELDDPAYVPARAALDGAELFDAELFGLSPLEAAVTDPQHRLLLECAWEALEHAGYDPRRYDGLIGVYAGAGPSSYLLFNLSANREALAAVGQLQALLANGADFLATRLSYKLGLRGPSLTVQTACSTSLVAVHLAVQSLLNGECDLALAGGVRVSVPRPAGYLYQTDGILSPDGRCRPFDAAARGSVDGEGAGIVVLKRLADALADGDRVHAVVLGTAINNDGDQRVGFTAPGIAGQAAVVAMAQAVAGVAPESIGFVEGHGTATPLGDPIEVAALRQVFAAATARRGFCALGSVKGNVGHLDAAAGVTSLIKAVLALERGLIPPTPHFVRPNPALGLDESPFRVNAVPLDWPQGAQPRRAGVSSFGMGGTNAHAVLEEAPPVPPGDPPRPWQLLVLSAAGATALEAMTDRLAGHLAGHPELDLADVAFTLQVGRRELAHRRAVVCRSLAGASEALAARDPRWVSSGYVAPEGGAARSAPATPPDGDAGPEALAALAGLWLAGAAVDWQASGGGERRLRVPLPTYPFARERHWLEPRAQPRSRTATPAGGARPGARPAPSAARKPAPRRARPALGRPYEPPRNELEGRLAALYEELLGVAPVGAFDPFFELGGHSLLGLQLLSRVKAELGAEVRLEALFHASAAADLAELVAAGGDRGAGAGPELIPRVPRAGDLPLSFAQERLWLLDRLDPGTPVFNLNQAVRLTGRLDPGALAGALADVVSRHESLRTAFVDRQGRPAQRIVPAPRVPLPVVDLAALPAARREAEAGRLAVRAGERRFDLSRPPLLAAELYRLARDHHAVALVLHHIVGDGWSIAVLLSELAETYGALAAGRPPPLAAPPVQYADFAAWQRGRLGERELAWQLAGWKARLAPPLPVLDLPTDRPRAAVQTFRGASETLALPPGLAGELRGLGSAQGATPFMVLLAGFAVLLSRWSGQEDLIVGSPIAGRDRRELEGLIGIFLNMLPLRIDLAGEPSFRDLLGRVRATALAAYAAQDVPVERLIEELQPRRDLARSPLFQVLFNLQDFPRRAFDLPELTIEALPLRELPSRFDLTIYGEEAPDGGIALELVYNAGLFDRATVAGLLAQLGRLLERVAAEPDTAVRRVPLLTAEAAAALPDPRRPLAAAPWTGAVHERFATRARRHPDRTAVVDEAATWSYGELARRAGRLARRLRAAGVGRGDRVAIDARRGAPLVQALLGVLQAGAAFAVLDPAHPAPRLAAVLRRVRPRAWVATAAAPLPDEPAAELAAVPRLALAAAGARETDGAARPAVPAAAAARPGDLAYVAFTSGTTGGPKGVLGAHGPLARFCAWHAERVGSAEERFSLLSGLAHDPLLRDAFTPLTLGAALAIPGPDELGSPGLLAGWMARQRVTACHLTPALGQLLATGGTALPDLARAFFGGDALSEGDVARLRPLAPGAAWINFYGTTETPQAVAWHDASGAGAWPQRRVPVGRGIDGVQLLVLDAAGELAAPGELGEVCVRTPHLCLGYLDDARLTAERLVAHPLAGGPGERVYRTGDLGRFRSDGEVDLAGRRDRQVQVRGLRVEPAEVEAALARLPAVREAAVAPREVPGRSEGRPVLVAWLVAATPGAVDRPRAAELRDLLRGLVPEPMVPEAFVWLERLPLTPNGKLDRAALPAPDPDEARGEDAAEPPATADEERIAAVWRDLLGLERVGRRESFFELGGHSLLGARMVAALREACGVEVPLRRLFEQPTVAALAGAVAELRGRQGGGAERIARLPRSAGRRGAPPDRFPVSPAQLREWILDRLQPGTGAYNVPGGARVTGPADLAALARGAREIVRRHEALRTTFAPDEDAGGEPVQLVASALRLPLALVDLAALPGAAREAEAGRVARAELAAPFDLARGPLVRLRAARLFAREHLVLVTAHHIVADGWSLAIFFRELAALYEAFAAGRPSPLPELPVQYADFALWQRERLAGERFDRQVAYWRRQLAGLPPLELPTDRPRPPVQRFAGGKHSFRLPAAPADGLRELARREGASLFMALAASYAALLGRYAGQDDFAVGTYSGNRDRTELEGLIGFFINSLVLRLPLAGEPGFRELLGRSREVTLEAFAHQDVPFETLLDALRVERDLSRTPLFQAMLVLQNFPRAAVDLAGVQLEPIPIDQGHADFDLTLWLSEDSAGVGGSFTYSTALFEEAIIARLGGHLAALIRAALAAPDRPVEALCLLAQEERRQLLEWGVGAAAAAAERRLHEPFAERARRCPEAAAVEGGGETLSYEELDRRAERLAGRLRRLGVGPEAVVGLAVERSPAMVAAMLAVLRAGGAYLPLDPAYPEARLAAMVADAAVAAVLTERRWAARLAATRARLVMLDEAEAEPAPATGAAAAGGALPANPAYVLYTSGSTGRPKGVAVEHRAIAAYAAGAAESFALGPGDRVLQFASISFDTSAEEIYPALASGATLVLRPAEMARSIAHFSAELARLRITVLDLPTAYWHELAAGLGREGGLPATVRLVIIGGERALPDRLALWRERVGPGVRLLNTYGPTEATVVATRCELAPGADGAAAGAPVEAPIGRPIPGVQARVVDRRGEPVPAGVPGELLLGGAGLARGYLGRPGATAERFVPDPLCGAAGGPQPDPGADPAVDPASGPGARLYRTGDRVRWRPDGALEFLGRIDRQVKIRGFRVELEEIEAAVRAHPAVRDAAVAARAAGEGEARLVAYLVRDGAPAPTRAGVPAPTPAGTQPLAADLRRFLQQRLPEFMVPAHYLELPALPLTPAGKLDRRALPEPRGARPGAAAGFAPPRSGLERTIAAVWRDLLGLDRIGAEDNLFDLGAHSLHMVRAHGRLREALGRELTTVDLFRHPSVRALADHLAGEEDRPAFEQVEDLAERQRAELGRRRRAQERLRAMTGGGARR